MATTTTRMVAIGGILIFIASYGSVMAQAPGLAPVLAPSLGPAAAAPVGSDCFSVLVNVSDCLTYVEDGSKLAKPDKGCCPELAGLVDSNPICLCQLLGNPDISGVKIDFNKALKLPSVCGVSTPPVSTCSGIPVPPASEGPLSPSGQPSELGPAASPSGSAAATPSPRNGASSIRTLSALPLVLGLAIVFAPTLIF
ncbi:Non-specific lipid-transfer protein-like protein [Quillaja saponaria]|uniref:Non-specific lipid-transfer protein-like protein n=1 Tax=Quillaja saponaria TaxID=32244 RepID=A0AAD7LUZ7_QUISA|nr:Non-specific lipid-transfer protein-like protein [Quillaja saponaria]